MVYQNKFVAVLKINNKILREQGEYVYIPFGSEYSLLLKNLNSNIAVVKIYIDGQEVTKCGSLLVKGNSEVELERFLENMNHGNRFKFIHKTSEIVDHRGDKIDDGFIRIEFTYEKEKAQTITTTYVHEHHYHEPWWRPYHYPTMTWGRTITSSAGTTKGGSLVSENSCVGYCDSSNIKFTSCSVPLNNSVNNDMGACYFNAPAQDEGITVPGSVSNQKFTPGWIGELEENSHTIIIRLKGISDSGKTISDPITVHVKLMCPICGRTHKSSMKFCSNCGASLI